MVAGGDSGFTFGMSFFGTISFTFRTVGVNGFTGVLVKRFLWVAVVGKGLILDNPFADGRSGPAAGVPEMVQRLLAVLDHGDGMPFSSQE